MVYGMIQAQASMLAFNDIYRILAVLMALMTPGFLLLRRGQRASGPAPRIRFDHSSPRGSRYCF